jgi:hypothetical protein
MKSVKCKSMIIKQLHYVNNNWVDFNPEHNLDFQLVLAFGSKLLLQNIELFNYLKQKFPAAQIVFSSTSGEILDGDVYDNTIVVTAVSFKKTRIECIETSIDLHNSSYEAGKNLLASLNKNDLKSVFIISDGTRVNGSELVSGLNIDNEIKTIISGGLAGDADNFSETAVGLNKMAAAGNIVAIGFYGSSIHVNCASFGGWDEFGRERIVTKSNRNILFEIDNRNALDLYKEYLGPFAEELPGSALLFPLSMLVFGNNKTVVRTILTINEHEKSMTFAGNIPEGSKVRFMKANFDKLIDASENAAKNCYSSEHQNPQLAILISCVGRKLILRERVSEEIMAAKDVLGTSVAITGFYSYGEIAPFNNTLSCELHNQTMTITTLFEE